jgi:hypothetical protein
MDSNAGTNPKADSSKELVEADSKLGKEDVRSVKSWYGVANPTLYSRVV